MREWRMVNGDSALNLALNAVNAWQVRISTLLLLIVLVITGCGRPEPQPLRFNVVPWQAGEASVYDITDVNGQYAGTLLYTIAISDTNAPGSWLLRRETIAQGDHEVTEVEITSDYLRPLHTIWTLENSGGQETIETTYRDGTVDMLLTSKEKQVHTERRSIPTNSYDVYTLLMLLRALPLGEAYATQMNIFTPLTGQLEFITVSVLKQEEVTTANSSYPAWVVEVQTGDRRSTIWIGTNAPYPVVKYIDARNGGTYELTSFETGNK